MKHLLGIHAAFILDGKGRNIVIWRVPRHFSDGDTPIHSKIQLCKQFSATGMPRYGDVISHAEVFFLARAGHTVHPRVSLRGLICKNQFLGGAYFKVWHFPQRLTEKTT